MPCFKETNSFPPPFKEHTEKQQYDNGTWTHETETDKKRLDKPKVLKILPVIIARHLISLFTECSYLILDENIEYNHTGSTAS